MTATLYKKNETGFDTARVEPQHVTSHIDAGWVTSIGLVYNKPEGEMSVPEIRMAAKKAGIEGYDVKQAKTLVKELSELGE